MLKSIYFYFPPHSQTTPFLKLHLNLKYFSVSTAKRIPRFTKALPFPVLLGLHLRQARNGAFKREDFFLGRENGA